MVDVCIAASPFLSVVRPALGASALIGELQADGIDARLDYVNMRFADRVGLDVCEHIAERTPTKLLIGEWVFSDCIRAQHARESQTDYVDLVRRTLGAEMFVAVQSLRDEAAPFAREMADRLLGTGARIIGFTTSFQQNCASLAIAKEIKASDPDRIVVLGGANCDGPMGAGLAQAYPFIDYVFQGESDISFPAFVRLILDGGCQKSRLVKGAPVMEMDSLAVPDFDDFFDTLEKMSYQNRVMPGLLFESSRGCWWGATHHCTFCGLNGTGMTYRSKSHDRVLEEIEIHQRRYGVGMFEAADNIMNMRHVAGIFDRLAEAETSLRFFYEIKSNMRPELLERIARGGVTWVQPGIESLHDTILKKMKKGVKGLHNVRLLRSCLEIGIKPVWNLLVGFPGETAEQYAYMASIMPALEHLDPPTGHSKIRLDRFSPYHNDATELGFRDVRPADAYAAIYGLSDALLEDIAYFFEGEAEGMPEGSYLSGIVDAIDTWRAKHNAEVANQTGKGLPELTITRAGPFCIIKDTRRIATQPVRILSPSHAKVLFELREPGSPHTVRDRAGPLPDPNEDWMQIVDDLANWHLIVQDPVGHAVSVVCETDLRVHTDESIMLFPGGSVLTSDQMQRIRKESVSIAPPAE